MSKWSDKIISSNVETLLNEGTEVDENLDNIEKVIELFKSWTNKQMILKQIIYLQKLMNIFKNEINLKGERTKILSELIDLTINCSKKNIMVNRRRNFRKSLKY